MITFSCDCGKRYQVKDELAGKRAKCSCGKTLVVPKPAAVPTHAAANHPQVPNQVETSNASRESELPHEQASAIPTSGTFKETPFGSYAVGFLFLKRLGAFAIAAAALLIAKIVPVTPLGDLSNALGAGLLLLIVGVITLKRISRSIKQSMPKVELTADS